MARTIACVVVSLLVSGVAAAQQAPKGLAGAWKATEIVVTGANAGSTSSPQPSLYIFTGSHYSIMAVLGTEPRTLAKEAQMTDQEKILAYDTLLAQSGTYEIAGELVTLHPIVARFPNFMAGGYTKYRVNVEGDTAWLTTKSTDLHIRVGDRVVPAPGPANETRVKLTRLE